MSSNYHTPVAVGAAANANTLNSPLGELDQNLYDLVHGDLAWTQLNHGSPVEVTIAGGVIAVTQTYHTVDTEADAASDNLDTINGGQVGDRLILRTANDARDVTVRNGVGNIYLSGGMDTTLSSTQAMIELFCLGTVWVDAMGDAVSSTFTRLVARTALGASAANIDITGISGAYSILALYAELRSDRAGNSDDDVDVRFNGDSTAANYYSLCQHIFSGGSTITQNLGATAGMRIARGAAGATSPTGYKSALEILIFNYASTTLPRQASGTGHLSGADSSGNLFALIFGGTWKNTSAAINQITLLPVSGSNFVAGSAYELWGIL